VCGLTTTLVAGMVPILQIDLAVPAWPIVMALEQGTPSVRLDVEHHARGRLVVNPICLDELELGPLARRLGEVVQNVA
jgi:hypothetical protein